MKGFKFPPCYDFPPFWTIQTNPDELKQQTLLWTNLICAFMKAIDKTELEITSSLETPLFWNKKINRRLNRESAIYFIDALTKTQNAVWLDDSKTRARILWRTLAQWGDILWKWADDAGEINKSPYTLYELVRGDAGRGEKFHGVNMELIRDACLELEKQGRGKTFPGDQLDEFSIKFITPVRK